MARHTKRRAVRKAKAYPVKTAAEAAGIDAPQKKLAACPRRPQLWLLALSTLSFAAWFVLLLLLAWLT